MQIAQRMTELFSGNVNIYLVPTVIIHYFYFIHYIKERRMGKFILFHLHFEIIRRSQSVDKGIGLKLVLGSSTGIVSVSKNFKFFGLGASSTRTFGEYSSMNCIPLTSYYFTHLIQSNHSKYILWDVVNTKIIEQLSLAIVPWSDIHHPDLRPSF